jgi:glutamine synthetase
MKDGYGYVEDRRPAANVDPYLAMMRIARTIIKE